ncbi:hypothetical protein P8452_20400 [Trifolium repens]|nr:hypothetical protein P8452_20400 [Trifolium repens]
MDGSSLGNPGVAASAGIFRNHNGASLGCFASNIELTARAETVPAKLSPSLASLTGDGESFSLKRAVDRFYLGN